MTTKTNLVIDGSNLLMISLSVNKDDVTNNNEYLGGFTGFLKILQGLLSKFCPHEMYVIFDKGKSEYRKSIYPAYKEGRHAGVKDQEMLYRWSHRETHTSFLRLMLGCLGVNVIEMQDVEGDDLITNFVTQSQRKNIIVSTDKDFLQLVDEKTSLYRPGKLDMFITLKNLEVYCNTLFKLQDLKFKKEWLTSMRILTGDQSDNIPGALKVGELRSVQLFNMFGNNSNGILNGLKSLDKRNAWQNNVIIFIESGNWELNDKLMDLRKGPKIPIKDLIQRAKYNYSEAYQFMLELKVDDFSFEDEIEQLICAYECLT